MKTKPADYQKIVADYEDAFLKANGKVCKVEVLPRGRCQLVVPSEGYIYTPTYFIKNLVAFTEALRKRIDEKVTSIG